VKVLSVLEQSSKCYDPMEAFTYALKAPESRRQYPRRFKPFLDYIGLEGTLEEQAKQFWLKAKHETKWAEDNLMQFIRFQKERATSGEISNPTIPSYYRATKLFCEMNDIILNWKKIARGLPRTIEAANDRAPTLEEIKKLVDYPDRRIKPIVCVMLSSGIRIGAFDYLKWKHIIPNRNEAGKIVAAKIIVYAGDSEEYYSFITPEAHNALMDWMNFRASYGEKITGESWVFKDLWQTTNITYGANLGLAGYPKKLKSSGIKRIIERALWEQGLRHPLTNGSRRHEWKAAHGFRKFYKTRAEQVMKPINVELTMGHNIGISASYYKPQEREILDDYLKAVELLTIYQNNSALVQKINKLSEDNENKDYIIQRKMEEKDKEIRLLRQNELLNSDAIAGLSDQIQALKNQMDRLQKQNST
jgi:hypothetical protein